MTPATGGQPGDEVVVDTNGPCETCGERIQLIRRTFVVAGFGIGVTVEHRLRCVCGEVPVPEE